MLRRRSIDVQPSSWIADGSRPRVLIEHHDASIGQAVADLLRDEGYDVSHCGGPADRDGHCPLVETGLCDRAGEADVVFSGLQISDEDDRPVFAALRRHFGSTPVIVEIPTRRVPLYAVELAGFVTVPRPITRDALLQALANVLQ